ncbi:MAG: hypothetical protein ACFCVD_03045 [Nodosilinea sp.]
MNGIFGRGYRYDLPGDLVHQKPGSAYPATEIQSSFRNDLPAMVLVFYGVPASLLLFMGLATYLNRKLKIKRGVNRLSQVANLERLWHLKNNSKN